MRIVLVLVLLKLFKSQNVVGKGQTNHSDQNISNILRIQYLLSCGQILLFYKSDLYFMLNDFVFFSISLALNGDMELK